MTKRIDYGIIEYNKLSKEEKFMIIREKYLSKIRPFYDQDLIKVIMGVRRCGKSVILLQIIDELKKVEYQKLK